MRTFLSTFRGFAARGSIGSFCTESDHNFEHVKLNRTQVVTVTKSNHTMGICASKDAAAIVEAKEGNIGNNDVELKESNPNEPLPVDTTTTDQMGMNDGEGEEEAGRTEKVGISFVRAPNCF
jgi:ABC-type xylose transport system substrate-binding protein